MLSAFDNIWRGGKEKRRGGGGGEACGPYCRVSFYIENFYGRWGVVPGFHFYKLIGNLPEREREIRAKR